MRSGDHPHAGPAPARLHKRYPVAELPTDDDSRPEIAAATAATLPPADRTGPPQTFAPGSMNHLALSSARLDQVRGGFTGDNGLRISFGIERAVYINGNLVTTTTLNLSELGKVSGGQVQVGGVAMGGTLGLIQNGPGNTFSPAALASGTIGTVIQNSLNDQKIQSISVINATVNSLDVLKSLNLQAAMHGALIGSLRR